MQETINLLKILNPKPKKRSFSSVINKSDSKNPSETAYLSNIIKKNKFPYAKGLNFNESKFEDLPEYLTQREDFVAFMYEKYEKKLLSIP